MRRFLVLCLFGLGACSSTGAPNVAQSVGTSIVESKIKAEAIGVWDCTVGEGGAKGFLQTVTITDGQVKGVAASADKQPESIAKRMNAPASSSPESTVPAGGGLTEPWNGTWSLDDSKLTVSVQGNSWFDSAEATYTLASQEPVTQTVQVDTLKNRNNATNTVLNPKGQISATNNDDGSWTLAGVPSGRDTGATQVCKKR